MCWELYAVNPLSFLPASLNLISLSFVFMALLNPAKTYLISWLRIRPFESLLGDTGGRFEAFGVLCLLMIPIVFLFLGELVLPAFETCFSYLGLPIMILYSCSTLCFSEISFYTSMTRFSSFKIFPSSFDPLFPIMGWIMGVKTFYCTSSLTLNLGILANDIWCWLLV